MLHFLVSSWPVPAVALVLSFLFILWKQNGGNLLFKSEKTDDPTTSLFKMIFAFGWAIGSIAVSIVVALGSALWLVIILVALLCGAHA